MGHLNMQSIQHLASRGLLGPSSTHVQNCPIPLFRACVHGKQHKRAIIPSTATGVIDHLHLTPGDCVSGDQVESSTPGQVPTYKGTPTTDRYHAGTLFVDHASRYLHFTPHFSTGAKEAIQEKHLFESLASQHHHQITCYHTDNGIFASKEF
jgi:hypothetical protein